MKALSEFQQECPIIHKETQGHKYTYADLPTIYSTINPLLYKYGLVVSQPLVDGCIETILYHVPSEEYMKSATPIPHVQLGNMNEYQAFGSGVTYYRRYALSSMLGLVTDKDTDAAGEPVKQKPKSFEVPLPKEIPFMNDVAMIKLVARYEAGEHDVFSKAAKHYKLREQDIETIQTLTNGRTV